MTATRRVQAVRTMTPTTLRMHPQSVYLDETPLPLKYQRPVWAADIVQEWKRRDDLLKADTYPTQSMIVRGRSGVGKSTAARWISGELGVPIYVMSIASTIESYMGSTGKNIDSAMKWGMEVNCVLLLDEVDSISASRMAKHSDVGEIWRITNSFIQNLDLWHAAPRNSLLIATSNMMDDSIDNAVARRFEVRVTAPMPDARELSRIAGVAWPEDYIVSHAECSRMVLLSKRQAVMRGMDYATTLMAMIRSTSSTEEDS